MNANELANWLESETQTTAKINAFIKKSAATMLRQFGLAESIIKQQEIQIEALKAEVKQWKDWKQSLNGWSKK